MHRLLALILLLGVYHNPITFQTTEDQNQIKRLLILYAHAHDMSWNAAGTAIVTATSNTIRVWDAITLEQRYFVRHREALNGIQFNASGDRFLTWSNSNIRVWQTETGQLLGRLESPSNSSFDGVIWHGSYVLNWFGGTIGLWDGVSSQNIAAVVVPGESFSPFHANVNWNQDRSRFLTWNALSVDVPLVRMWAVDGSLENLTQVMTLEHDDDWIDGAAWSPDETMVASWSQRMVKVWDIENGDLLHVLNSDSYLTDASWSPNSRYILVEDIRENAMRVWDARTGEEVLTLAGTDAMWDTTGERLLVGRQTVRLLDVATGDELAEFGPSLGLGSAQWNPDGIRLLVDTAFGIQVWVIPPQDECVVHALAPANLRAEPSTRSEIVDDLPPHQLVYVIGQTIGADGLIWWQLTDDRWVRSDVVEETGRCFT